MADFDNISAVIDSAIDRQDYDAAGELLLSGAGIFLLGMGSAQALRWVSSVLQQNVDDATRARVLVSGARAAVCVGAHDKIVPWSEEAARLSRQGEPIVFAIASMFHSTPLMDRQPERAGRAPPHGSRCRSRPRAEVHRSNDRHVDAHGLILRG